MVCVLIAVSPLAQAQNLDSATESCMKTKAMPDRQSIQVGDTLGVRLKSTLGPATATGVGGFSRLLPLSFLSRRASEFTPAKPQGANHPHQTH